MSRGKYHYHIGSERGSGVSASTAIGVFVVCAVGVSFLFLNFTPDTANGIQLSHNVPPVRENMDQLPVTAESSESAPDPLINEQTARSCQEIADSTGPGETLFSLLYANLLDEVSARSVAKSLANAMSPAMKKGFDAFTSLAPGTRYSMSLDQNGAFQKITLELDPSRIFICEAQGESLRSWKEDVVIDFKVETLRLKVNGSLEKTVLDAGEGQTLASELRNIFRWDIDFQYDSLRGDECTLLFERRYFDDRPSGYGRILCAVYDGKKTGRRVGVFFHGKYYAPDGSQLEKDFLKTPLKVIRVTSKYGMRFHPVKREWRKHSGVDYGAPTGTPVFAVSRGVVSFSGWSNGYGNYVCIKHDNGYESRYGHLSKIFLNKGQRVKQGQRVGLVGQTGIATGPHLDFQLLMRGQHVNPLDTRKVKMAQSPVSIPAPLKGRFKLVAAQNLARLDATESILVLQKTNISHAR